ncbi:MAG: folate-binding protein [Scytolyngbya sp. HA4215-MV1]|jgi:hypothetical protein|nr:folate-binding protein [Scytolyngbya sp. HA4215-MV1]
MSQALRDIQGAFGAVVEADVPVSFGNDVMALQAAISGVALYDRTHWGRIRVTDADRLSFLHNQSSNDFKILKPGQGCDTVFLTSTARTIDLITAYVLADAVWLVTSPEQSQKVMTVLDRYIFFADKVKLTDVSAETAAFSLIGPASHALLDKLGAGALVGQPYASHQTLWLAGQEVLVAVGNELAIAGYTVIAPIEQAASLWQSLVAADAVPLGNRAWQQLRIQQGRPMPGHELTEDYNPLEAGLWQTISFNKGCYIGQETIARLDTYKGVKQQLWGIRFHHSTELGSPITLGTDKVGTLTSLTQTEQGYLGLAYIRTKVEAAAGLKVQVGNWEAELVDLPFVTRDRQS